MLVFSRHEKINRPLVLDNQFRLVKSKGFLKKTYSLFDGEYLVHESVVFRFTRLSVFAGYVFVKVVGNCFTNPLYRGQGIYGWMINFLIQKEGKFILFVEEENINSQKGLTKIDFSVIDKFRYKKLGWIYWVIRG